MIPPLSAQGFADIFSVSRETLARLEAYADLLICWAARINLVGHDTLADLWRRHMLDSAQIAAARPGPCAQPDRSRQRRRVSRSGAGDPRRVRGRACRGGFAQGGVFARGGSGDRGGGDDPSVPDRRGAASSGRCRDRAGLAPLARLLDFARPFLGPETVCLFPKGERVQQELTLARKFWTIAASHHQSIADPRGVVLRLHRVVREPDGG